MMAAKKKVSFNDLFKDMVATNGLATTKDIQAVLKRIDRLEKKMLALKNTGVSGQKSGKRVLTTQPVFNAIKQKKNGYQIINQACPLFVPLAEEGFAGKPVTKTIAKNYLYPLKLKQIDTLILGCTHYPLLKDVIQEKIGRQVKLIDPAEQTAEQLKRFLADNPDLENTLPKNNQLVGRYSRQ